MDARLWHIRKQRPVRLRQNDLPRVAEAILDVEKGRAVVRTGFVRGTSFVNLHRDNAYDVVIRGDDWAKIVPFLRNSGSLPTQYAPLPSVQPDVPSPQPNLMMRAPPPLPTNGLTSFLAGFDYGTMRNIVSVLNAAPSIDQLESNSLAKPSSSDSVGPTMTSPLPGLQFPMASLDPQERLFFNQVLGVLYRVFRDRFPTSNL